MNFEEREAQLRAKYEEVKERLTTPQLWLLWEIMNLKRYFDEHEVDLDDVPIPTNTTQFNAHSAADTVENMIASLLRWLGYDQDDHDAYEVVDCRIELKLKNEYDEHVFEITMN
jgi:hypothetical protein